MEHGPSGAAHALPPLLPRRQSAGMLSRQQAGELEEAEGGVGTPMALPAVAPPPRGTDSRISLMATSPARTAPPTSSSRYLPYLPSGQLFTWGHASSGQLGQERFLHPPGSNCCALPYPVPGWTRVAHVSCGGLEEGFTVLSTDAGDVFTLGKDLFGRLGHGNCGRTYRHEPEPRLVQTLRVRQCRAVRVAAGAEHAMCLSEEGQAWSWGRNIGGCLGRGTIESPGFKPIVVASELSRSDPRFLESLPSPVFDLGHGRSSWIGTHFGRLPKKTAPGDGSGGGGGGGGSGGGGGGGGGGGRGALTAALGDECLAPKVPTKEGHGPSRSVVPRTHTMHDDDLNYTVLCLNL